MENRLQTVGLVVNKQTEYEAHFAKINFKLLVRH